MKFILGEPPVDSCVARGIPAPWVSVKQLTPAVYAATLLLSLGMLGAFFIYALTACGVFSYRDYMQHEGATIPAVRIILETILQISAVAIVHELIHAALTPGGGLSQQTIIGALPKKGIFYVFYSGELSRSAFFRVASGPFVLLSIAPPIVAYIFNIQSAVVGLTAVYNAVLSSIDAITIGICWACIPAGCAVRQSGNNIYYFVPC